MAVREGFPEPADSLVPPLADNERLVDIVAKVTREPRRTVRQKLYREETTLGAGIRDEMTRRGIAPYIWTDALARFYDENDSFLYGSIAWNRTRAKRAMRAWIASYLAKLGRQRVLAFGDGPGFDSLHLALSGHDVTYFDVSRFDAAFAAEIFAIAGVTIRVARHGDDLPPGAYDVVTCMDVLEHVPDPPQLVGRFARLLRPGGRLIVSAPFFLVSPDFLTHLDSNRRYSGDLSRLYRRNGFALADGRLDWSPLVFVKMPVDSEASRCHMAKRLALGCSGVFFSGARFSSAPYAWLARLTTRSTSPWLDGLSPGETEEKEDIRKAA
jgi:2-polyprenyl-3-methyl-5-hydroxy-6-metoxy-1,4-benzoquinol methylase